MLRLLTLSIVFMVTTLAVSAADLDWIAKLPGVSVMTSRESAEGDEVVYTVSNPSKTFESVKSGLAKRGWVLSNRATVVTTGTNVMALVAIKGKEKVRVSVQAVGVINTMAVVAGPALASDLPVTPPGQVVVRPGGINLGASLVLNDNHQSGVHNCTNSSVVVNSNHNAITLQGTLASLAVNGNHNNVTINTTAPVIVVNGNHNLVRARAGQAVQNNGQYNSIQYQ